MSLRELLDWDLEQFRKETAGLDADLTIRDVLVDELDIDEDEIDALFEDEDEDCEDSCDYTEDDCEDCDDYDDEDYEEEDDSYDEVDTPSLTSEEKELADSIIDDIDNGRYSIDTIRGIYSSNIVDYVADYVD